VQYEADPLDVSRTVDETLTQYIELLETAEKTVPTGLIWGHERNFVNIFASRDSEKYAARRFLHDLSDIAIVTKLPVPHLEPPKGTLGAK
jgi:hypothetical protein